MSGKEEKEGKVDNIPPSPSPWSGEKVGRKAGECDRVLTGIKEVLIIWSLFHSLCLEAQESGLRWNVKPFVSVCGKDVPLPPLSGDEVVSGDGVQVCYVCVW